jgi:4-amino-4-deoxy-L-arabinose transferase-like glycosyltransferase
MAHLAGPTVYDLVGWALVMLVVVRILRTGDQRLWLFVGLTIGVSLYAKHTILLLVIALLVGFVVCRQWNVLRSPYLWTGAVVAALLWVPNLLWQAGHGWPTLAMSGALQENHSGAEFTITFVILQFVLPGIWAAPVWLAGLRALLRERRLRDHRAFAVAYLLLFVLIAVAIADRPYYLAPLYLVLIGAGSVVTAGVVKGSRRFFSERTPKRRLLWRSPIAAYLWVAVFALLLLPVSLPVLPARWLATVPLQSVNYNLGEEIGWPELAETVADVYRDLPPAERARTAIVTANYGEAGALDRYGPALGLPPAQSGHNNYWWWGAPAADATTVIVVGFWGGRHLEPYFAESEQAAAIVNAAGVDNDEDGLPIWVCRGLTRPWAEMWADFRHYD